MRLVTHMVFLASVFTASAVFSFTYVVTEPNGVVVKTVIDGNRITITDSKGAVVHVDTTYGSYDGHTRTINGHPGGYIYKAIAMVRQANARGDKVRLMCEDGCISASTLWLNAKNVCIGEKAWFGFHGAAFDIFGLIPDTSAELVMADNYPKNLRFIFLTKWRKRHGWFYRVEGDEIRRMTGIKKC